MESALPRLSEDELIATIFAPLAGPGGLQLQDDAALLKIPASEELVLTKDMLVAGVHFFADDPPDAIARKALRVNLSDLAAKGAAPKGFLLGLGLPGDWQEDWLKAFAAGLADDAAHFAISLLGGDTVRTPGPLTLSITAFGSVPEGKMIPRGAAKAGDHLFVTGTIGDAALGLRLRQNAPVDQAWIGNLDASQSAYLRERYLLPRPRLALRAALRAHAHAAMDISDGFVGDLSKMLRLAGLTAEIDAGQVPLSEVARAVLAAAPSASPQSSPVATITRFYARYRPKKGRALLRPLGRRASGCGKWGSAPRAASRFGSKTRPAGCFLLRQAPTSIFEAPIFGGVWGTDPSRSLIPRSLRSKRLEGGGIGIVSVKKPSSFETGQQGHPQDEGLAWVSALRQIAQGAAFCHMLPRPMRHKITRKHRQGGRSMMALWLVIACGLLSLVYGNRHIVPASCCRSRLARACRRSRPRSLRARRPI